MKKAGRIEAGRQLLPTAVIPVLALFAGAVAAQEMLPFPTPPTGGKVGPTMQESVHKWRAQARHLPEDAPNVLIVMLDDAGFGQAATFGGEITTPTLSRLADEGISYNAFHTVAMCSPTRAALMTGRNHNRVGFGQSPESLPSHFAEAADRQAGTWEWMPPNDLFGQTELDSELADFVLEQVP